MILNTYLCSGGSARPLEYGRFFLLTLNFAHAVGYVDTSSAPLLFPPLPPRLEYGAEEGKSSCELLCCQVDV